MKFLSKILLIVIIGCVAITSKAQSNNPIVERLSEIEIAKCITPEAVTYNFIESILFKDFNKMLSFADYEFAEGMRSSLESEYLTNDMFFKKYFSEQGGDKLNILGWLPALIRNYEVAIAYVRDDWYYEEDGYMRSSFNQVVKNGMIYIPGEIYPRKGINIKVIYVTCSPSSEIDKVGFQDITRYGNSNVKVMLQQFNGVWKVTGFK